MPKTTRTRKPPQRERVPKRKDVPGRQREGWMKKDRVWRSEKAQVAARGKAKPATEEDRLAACALAKKGPGGYEKFGDIPAHKLGRALRTGLYKLANSLPGDESTNLVSRIKAAATTVTASLATGFGEGTFRSGVSGALQCRGALLAIQDHLEQLAEMTLVGPDDHERLKKEVDAAVAAVNEFLGRLARERNRLQGEPSPR